VLVIFYVKFNNKGNMKNTGFLSFYIHEEMMKILVVVR